MTLLPVNRTETSQAVSEAQLYYAQALALDDWLASCMAALSITQYRKHKMVFGSMRGKKMNKKKKEHVSCFG